MNIPENRAAGCRLLSKASTHTPELYTPFKLRCLSRFHEADLGPKYYKSNLETNRHKKIKPSSSGAMPVCTALCFHLIPEPPFRVVSCSIAILPERTWEERLRSLPKTIQLANARAGIQRASLHGGCCPGALPTSERTHLIRRVGDTWGRGRALERGSRGPRKAASRLTREHKPQAQPRATSSGPWSSCRHHGLRSGYRPRAPSSSCLLARRTEGRARPAWERR